MLDLIARKPRPNSVALPVGLGQQPAARVHLTHRIGMKRIQGCLPPASPYYYYCIISRFETSDFRFTFNLFGKQTAKYFKFLRHTVYGIIWTKTV